MKVLGIEIPFNNQYYRIGSSYSFFFFLAWSLWWSLYAIWLKNTIGLTGEELGVLYSLNQFTSITFMVIYGIVQDKLGLKKYLMWAIGAVLVLTGPFLIYVYEPNLKEHFYPIVTLGSIFFGIGYLAGCGLVDSYIEKMSRRFRFEFGTARFWGSLGYAIGAFIAGTVFVINPHINFWMVSVVGCVFLLNNFLFDEKKSESYNPTNTSNITKDDFIKILKDKNFWLFVVFVMISWAQYTIYDQQLFTVFYTTLFDDPSVGTRVYGYLNAVQVGLEAICMAIIPFFVNRIGPKAGLMLGGVIMTVRILMSGLFVDPYIISFVKLFHALEVPLFVISVFKYAAANFDKRLSSTVYLIGFQIASSIGVIALSTPIGILFDKYGYQTVFYSISVTVAVMVVYSLFALSNKRLK